MSVAQASEVKPTDLGMPASSTEPIEKGEGCGDDGLVSCSMRELFEQGTKIATHRKDNVFQELDKRTLSEEEELVIKMRVEHQRKMYALFEKQERTRKIEELKELCAPAGEESSFGGLTDEEAGRALDLCDGDEQQAAAALTGELGAAFRRRCMEPERIAEMKEDKKRERAAAKRSAAKVGGKWHAMPDPSMRGKPVDRAQLEGAIFVGAFRGKGFQGNGKSGKMVLRKLTEKETGASDGASDAASGGDAGKENADDVAMAEAAVEGAVGAGGAGADLPSGTPGGSKEPLSQSQEDNMAGAKSVSPKGVNRRSTPKGGPTPKSTARGKKRTSTERAGACTDGAGACTDGAGACTDGAGACTDGAGVCDGAPAPQQQQQQPSPTRKSVRQRTSTAPAIEEIDPNKTDDHLARINATESDEEAAAFLNSLGSDKLVSHLLQALGASDPIRAIGIRQAFDERVAAGAADEGVVDEAAAVAPELAPAAVPAAAPAAAPADVPDAELQAPVDRSNANANASTNPPAESEGTVSVQVVEDATTQANTPASKQKPKVAAPKAKVSAQPAVSVKGHTHRGRVKQKSHKSAELIEAGTLRLEKGWFNAGYIFPEGFKSRTLFRSSVALDSLCVHECDIIGKGGLHWPLPTFRVVALDRPDEPLLAKSCTGCWTAILKRINSEIEARRQAGEDLPPPPKTAIAGPEYFGFNQADIQEAVEALDPNREVEVYWSGKVERNRARKGLPPDPAKAKTVRRTTTVVSDKVNKVNAGASGAGAPAPRRGRRPAARTTSSGHDVEEEDDGDEANFVASRWSAVSRTERYRNRLQDAGDDEAAAKVDSENPIPDFMDPITLEPVIAPAISPYGHVMGSATWRVVLGAQGVCPFTKKPLRWEQCKVLTKNNYDAYKDSIIQ